MALDSTKARSAVTGAVSVGPVGSASPTSEAVALTGFNDLGYLNENGIEVIPDRSTKDMKAWQNADIVRTVTTDAKLTFKFVMIETSAATIELYWGVPVTRTATNGTWDLSPGVTGGRKSFVFDVVDGTDLLRYYVASGELESRETIKNVNGDLLGYGVTIVAYPSATLANKPARVWSSSLKTGA